MFLIDTSVWINIFRDRTGVLSQSLAEIINDESIFLSIFTQMNFGKVAETIASGRY